MKISYNQLKRCINITQAPQDIADLLTGCGLEVESIEKFEAVPGGLKGIVVGEVVEKIKHPDADKLSITKVNVGESELLNIVCGAPNVAVGQKVLVALVGCNLFPIVGESFQIKKSKIRGVVSEGMICAEDEIGMGTGHDGIMVLDEKAIIGTHASEYFHFETDYIFEIGLTPNRGDAVSHYGVARDLAAVLNCKEEVETYSARISGIHELPPPSGTTKTEIEVVNLEACKRYCGITIAGVTVKESPLWLKNSLKAIGIRPINNIVDVTNFVLHELGQPLHAFDSFKIKGQKVLVKKCDEGTKFITLDEVERKLSASDLMICNVEEPMCIAGVFGGKESGVNENTVAIFLESAYFDPTHIRLSSKHHGLKTDASFRFERGTDPEMVPIALNRAVNLILEIAGGNICSEMTDVYPEKLQASKIAFSFNSCFEIAGKEIPKKIVKNILTSLGIEIATEGGDGLLLSVPLYKSDVTREIDVTEEVMRIYGYNNIEESGRFSFSPLHKGEEFALKVENNVADFLSGNGFSEIINTSLTKDTHYQNSENFKDENHVRILNPLSVDLNMMRRNLLFGGLETIAYNSNRKNYDLKLFEFGRTYSKIQDQKFKYSEEKHFSLFVCGRRFTENPYGQNQAQDISSLKSYANELLNRLGISNLKISESTGESFSSGLSYFWKNKILLELGQVKKSVLKKFDIKSEVFYADINWNHLVKAASISVVTHKEVSRFPSVRRDLALLLDKNIKYKQIYDLAFSIEKKLLKEVNLFDVFEGEKIGKEKKSYAVSFTLQDEDATLTDNQIESIMQKLIKAYEDKLGALLR